MLRSIILGTTAALTFGTVASADLSSMTWDEIVAQAQEESELVWFQWYFNDRFREVVKGFEVEYGITVTLPDLDSGDLGLNKILAEGDRAVGDVDVLSIPGSRADAVDVADFFMGPILPILPNSEDITDQAEGGDWEGYAIKFWGNQTGIAYNSARTDFETLPQTVPELEAWMEANPEMLGFNFENGGSGPSLIHNRAIVKSGVLGSSRGGPIWV